MRRQPGAWTQEGRTPPVGITWDVTEILDRWAHPGRAEDTLGKPVLIKWWLLNVSGPLPGRQAERGEFLMEVAAYGHTTLWWITLDLLTGVAGAARLAVMRGPPPLDQPGRKHRR